VFRYRWTVTRARKNDNEKRPSPEKRMGAARVCCAVNKGLFLCCVICVFYLLVILVRLSVPVQVICWKNSCSKWPIIWWER